MVLRLNIVLKKPLGTGGTVLNSLNKIDKTFFNLWR